MKQAKPLRPDVLGIDIGGVLIQKARATGDTSFFSKIICKPLLLRMPSHLFSNWQQNVLAHAFIWCLNAGPTYKPRP